MDVIKEALLHYRSMWSMWLELKHTTEAERELARVKIALIDAELTRRNESAVAEPKKRMTLRKLGELHPAFMSPEVTQSAERLREANADPRNWHCANCGEQIVHIAENPNLDGSPKHWAHLDSGELRCEVATNHPAFGKNAEPIY
ncbi:hypothetical protein PBI_OAKER_52 [Mycobacterium phage Oaker]|uniref:hypothetical protein n=1 Tax=Mycobacterium phage Oaker TaxID=1445727 RepID=UPI0003E34EF3|nr:hypothetical protein CH12_gp52 [Mycobacterium phage Oaker]AHG24443.1 hypothetical protein PBI_OAKER_52 [Mycobacterium phage Oaker]